jgi:hypothetical protein
MSEPNNDPSVFPTNSEAERRLFADSGFKQRGMIGGNIPVMVEFEIDGFPGQFRSRGSWWWFTVATKGGDPDEERDEILNLCSFYDDWPAAGWMPLDQAYLFVEQGITLFRTLRTLSGGTFDKLERKLG